MGELKPTPGSLWDEAVAHTAATGPQIREVGRQMLAVTKEPNVRAIKEIPRRLDLVAPELRRVFRGLVSGELRWPLYLHGLVGTGKTLAALCLHDHVPGARYVTVEKLADAVVAQNDREWTRLRENRLVVLDELGARQRDTDLHYTAIQRLADIRELRNRVAVYVSNLSIVELAALYDDRIASRLSCGTRFELKGADRRR